MSQPVIPSYLLDSNVLLRFITKQPPDMAVKARDLLKRAQEGQVELILHPMAVAEVVYILRAHYKHTYPNIETILLQLFASGAMDVIERDTVEAALARVVRNNVDFEDAYFAELAIQMGGGIASFDQGFGKAGVDWLEP